MRFLNKAGVSRSFALEIIGLPAAEIRTSGIERGADGKLIVEVGPDQTREIRVSVQVAAAKLPKEAADIEFRAADVETGLSASVRDHFVPAGVSPPSCPGRGAAPHTPLSSPGPDRRPSIPETPAIEPRRRGVLGPPLSQTTVVDGAPYAVLKAGGALGRISANATWMMPPASPSATPIRHAMV